MGEQKAEGERAGQSDAAGSENFPAQLALFPSRFIHGIEANLVSPSKGRGLIEQLIKQAVIPALKSPIEIVLDFCIREYLFREVARDSERERLGDGIGMGIEPVLDEDAGLDGFELGFFVGARGGFG